MEWSRKRHISLFAHLTYLGATSIAGAISAWMLWDKWFNDPFLASIGVFLVEVLAFSSLVLHIARIKWPLSGFRHFIPAISILPLGYELFLLLYPQQESWAFLSSGLIACWFLFISHRFLVSLEELFIDPVTATKEAAQEEMSRLSLALARYQETRAAAEQFAQSVIIQRTPSSPPSVPLLPAASDTSFLLHENADPRLTRIISMASRRDGSGQWLFTPEQLSASEGADLHLVMVACKLVRSGQLQVPNGG